MDDARLQFSIVHHLSEVLFPAIPFVTTGKSTALSFKTTSIILVILRKTIIFAHSDAGSTASGVSFYRSYKIIFVGGNQMRQRSFFDFRLNFRYAKIRFILLICNILHV